MDAIKIEASADVDQKTWDKVAAVLDGHYITISDALGLMMHYIAAEEALPFPCIPLDPETIAEIRSAERGDMVSFDNVADLMAYLNADDDEDD
ncbi:MAG: type II toxin-antitoxin system RelB/DinJ family antitoxin [Chloroflexota bacterium]|nr:type II toxin-antitoxin system RelB/DinJ family antitoxin [Chloroflexota bacterium]MDE2683975.1 type II toxin-antitoxin system RelB/DinJ family antitoxin [Chloroflexota bacterium]